MKDQILPILEFDELIELFEYTNQRAARRAINNGTFPVPVFTLANRTVAHVDAVTLYFNEQRSASMTWLKNRYGIEENELTVKSSPKLDLYRKIGSKSDNPAA